MSHPVDVHVGKLVRHYRWIAGLTQSQLAKAVGVKFQQIQKYETAANRVSASRLSDIATVLKIPVSAFFAGLDQEPVDESAQNGMPRDILADKEAMEFLRSYYAIPETQRRRIFELARVLAEES